MNKKLAVLAIIVVAGVLAALAASGPAEPRPEKAFHVTLAEPSLYEGGTYSETFTIGAGTYSFGFVPNGSSPGVLSISMAGKSFEFEENFELESELQQTGISEYHTWDYAGQKVITVPEAQEVTITIDPNGNVMGSVSVDIVKEA